MKEFLTTDQIRKNAPSVFTAGAYEETGKQYAPISTFNILENLQSLGFGVTSATESRVRVPNRVGYARHMLRLRRQEEKEVGGMLPEIVLINAHDGTSSYQLRAGIYRLVCSNGMIVGNDMFHRKVRHQGDVLSRVAESCGEIIDVFPTAVEKAEEWKQIALKPDHQIAFANAASFLRWEEDGKTEVSPRELLRVRRIWDQGNDLWTTFNVIQENLIRGGIRTRNKENGRRRKSQKVTSVSENARLNTALWKLTEHMASLAK